MSVLYRDGFHILQKGDYRINFINTYPNFAFAIFCQVRENYHDNSNHNYVQCMYLCCIMGSR